MTNKEKYLYHLNQARVGNTHWTGMIRLLVSGLLKNKSELELNITEIGFGKWLYNEAMLLKDTSCTNVINDMEVLWEEIHQQYMTIYEICVQNVKKNIFGAAKPLEASEKQLADYHYQELVVLMDKLKNSLRNFEKQLHAKGEDEFIVYDNYLKSNEYSKSLEEKKKRIKKEQSSAQVSGARGAYLT